MIQNCGLVLSPALEGHVAKYRKLVPALALIDHLAEGGRGGVGVEALLRVLAAAEYLETHARRIYGASDTVDIIAAEAILLHIRRGALKDGFTARDVHQSGWSKLTDREHVQRGLDLLAELGHLAAVTEKSNYGGGRRSPTRSTQRSGGDRERVLSREASRPKISKRDTWGTLKTLKTWPFACGGAERNCGWGFRRF